jgi:O-acetyl-ADP-ribose deacetylase (regulator of RNase III)
MSAFHNGRSSTKPASSLYGEGNQPSSGNWQSSSTKTETLSSGPVVTESFQEIKRRRTEGDDKDRDGLDVITIKGLPPHANEKTLLAELRSRLKSAKYTNSACQFDFFYWDKSKGEVRVQVNDMEAVFALWRTRHKSPLKYESHVLSWDVTVADTYEEERILVEGLPQDITAYNLQLHIDCSECLPKHVQMQLMFLEGNSKAIINFDDTIVDSLLVDDLNKNGAEYEGNKVDTHLQYSLIPVSRAVQLSGLESCIDKGTLRNYFNSLYHSGKLSRPLLVEDIQVSQGGSAVVEFRTVDDCQEVLKLDEMPSLGVSGYQPAVKLYLKYPKSETVDVVRDGSLVDTPSSDKEAECAKAVEMTPDDPLVLDFICQNPRYKRRLNSTLSCDDLEWNGSTLLILKPSISEEECKKKLQVFLDDFCCKQLLVPHASLWEKSLKFVEDEIASRSFEGKMTSSEQELKVQFIGLEAEVVSLHQCCGNAFSEYRREFEEETEEIQEVVSLPSMDHLDVLQRSNVYGNFPEEVTVVKRRAGSKAYLDVKGPRKLVAATRTTLLEEADNIEPFNVAMDARVIKFLRAFGLGKLNAMFEDMSIPALASKIEEASVRLLLFPETEERACDLAMETYKVVSIKSMDDKEMQKFIRSQEYSDFVVSLCKDHEVLIDPDVGDMKELPTVADLSVVGMATDATAASQRLQSFLSESTMYIEEIPLDHPGFAKFLQTVQRNQLSQVLSSISHRNGGIDIRQKEEVIVLRSTKDSLNGLKDEIQKLLQNIKYEEADLKTHGLVRFLRSELFKAERSKIEQKSDAIVWIEGEDGSDDDEEIPNSDRRYRSGAVSSTKVAEFLVREVRNKRVCLYKGDICRHSVDVIVNAANESLEHFGGLARHISQCAGSSVQQECRSYIRKHGKLATGDAMYTNAGRLSSARYVIHAVFPQWPGETRDTTGIRRVERDLESAVKSSLLLAEQLKCKTIAFPAISSGVYGCPVDVVAKQIVQATSDFMTDSLSTTLTEVHVVLREEETEKIRSFQKRMEKDLDPIAKPAAHERREVIQKASESEVFVPLERRSVSRSRHVTQSLNVNVKSGDLSMESCDVIVNSTNGSLDMNSAMASKCLLRKAGHGLQSECTTYINANGKLQSGELYRSKGYNLSCQYVVHVICPNDPQGMSKAVEDCLNEAKRSSARSVSFPALGTGKLGMADAVAAKAMFDGIEKFASTGSSSVSNVSIVIFDAPRLPIFQQEKAKRSVIDESDEEIIAAFSDKFQLPNGTVVSVEQGDITADGCDVIVAPTGVVYSAVVKKSQQTDNDLHTRYGGTPNPVADLVAGGQLLCRRVYAVSVPSRSRNSSDDQCIRAVQNVVEQCLNLANSSRFASIAIPAIGTGGLGYSNRHTAAAVIEASKAFASKSSSPSLRHIKISVFDSHRVSDFQQELQVRSTGRKSGGFLQKVASGFRSFGAAVGSLFSSDHRPTKPKRTKKPLKSFSEGEEDLASVTAIAASRSTCQSVHSMLRKAVKDNCISTTEDIDKVPEGFDASELKTIAAEFGVALKFDVESDKSGTAKLTLSGFKDDVRDVHTRVLQRLNKAFKEEAESATKERILEKGRWLWQEDDGSFQPYSDEATVKIETARENGESTVKISHKGIEYNVDIANQLQTARGRKSRKIRKEDKFQPGEGMSLPQTWINPGNSQQEYDLYIHKLQPSDSEYQTVHTAYTSTGGPVTVLSIERVQNPKAYRRYLQEKADLNRRRQQQIATGAACLDVMAFHGTSEASVQQIMSNGFNRSYAGRAAGKAFGAGVYFASNAQLSSGYSPAGTNQHRKMFYCEVLIGCTTVGNSSMLEPPVINSAVSATDKYDSTVNNVATPTIYVSCYRDYMAYPTYLITFQ